MTTYYKRITGSKIQGDATAIAEQPGTLVINDDGTVHIHDGTTVGGNPIGGGGFATTSTLINGSYSVSLSSSTGILTLSTASTILGQGTDPNVYIETASSGTTSVWTFGTNGELTLPSATPVIKGAGTGTDVTIVAESTSSTSTWVFGSTGTLVFPDHTVQTTAYTGAGYGGQVWISEFTATNTTTFVAAVTSVQYDSSNNILATANVLANGPDLTTVFKLSPNGQVLWEQTYGSGVSTDGWGLAVDNNDDVYMAGSNSDSYGGLFIVKMSGQDGAGIWGNELTSGYENAGWVVEVGLDNDPVIVGYAKNGSDKDLIVTKFSTTGTNLWQTIIGDIGLDEEAYGMAVGPNNEIVAVGYSGSTQSNVLIVIKLDAYGTVLWQQEYHYQDNQNSNGVDADIDSAGNIYVSATLGVSGGATNLFTTMKLDSSGNILWARDITGGPCGTVAGALAIGPDDNIYISASTFSEINTGSQVLVGAYNSSGVELWQKRLNVDVSGYLLNVGNNNNFIETQSGSNIDVKNGHIVVSGSRIYFGNGGPEYATSKGWVTQFNIAGDPFTLGDYILDASGLTDEANTGISVTTSAKAFSIGALTVSSFEPSYNPGGLTQVSYISNISVASNQLVNGSYTVTLDSNGALNLPSNNVGGPSDVGVIQTLNGYPTLLAYGGSGHGGPEFDWMNTDTLTDFFSSSVTRNVMYINGDGLYVEMNANNVSGHPQPSWSFNPDGTTDFPGFTLSTATGATGTVLTLDGSGVASWQIPSAGSSALFVAGSGWVGTTGYSFDNATNHQTGMYSVTANELKLVAGDADIITMTSSGITLGPPVNMGGQPLNFVGNISFPGWNNNIGRRGYQECNTGTATVIWTSSNTRVTSMRLTVHAEVQRGSGTWYENFDTETTELLVAVRYENNLPTMARVAVIGAVSTLDVSLATYDVQINGSNLIELTCTPNPAVNERVITKVEYSESGSSSGEDYC